MPNLTDLPREVIGAICDYAYSPADIYNLHFTNKTLFRYTKEKDEVEGRVQGKSNFARKMQNALVHSLERTLRQNRASTDRKIDIFKSFTQLAKSLPPGSVAMSGSIVVQAVLGEQWGGSDIDVYCTNQAAPSVRTWIISELKQVLVGICARYTVDLSIEKGPGHNDIIDHVEHWANAPEENRAFQCTRGRTWRFNSGASFHSSPLWSQGNEVHLDREEIDRCTPSTVIRTKGDLVDIPFEPRLLDQCCENDCQGTKKDIVNIDLIVVNQRSSIARAINDFDIVMCKCSWDGNKFNIPRPADTFGRQSELSNCLEVRKTQAYVARIEREAHRPFRSVVSELIDGRTRKPSTNFWQLRHEGAIVHNFLCSKRVVPDTEAAKDLELVIDYFNVFSELLDCELPLPILSLIKAMREVLIENALVDGKFACRRFFRTLVSTHTPACQNTKRVVADSHWRHDVQNTKRGVHQGALAHSFRRHNVIVRSLDRLQKYRNRGIEVKPNDFPPRGLEQVLRKLNTENLRPSLWTLTHCLVTSRYIWERDESTDEDSDEDSMNDSDDVYSYASSYGVVNKRERDEASRIRAVRLANDSEEARQKDRVAEERKAMALAREEERWVAYRALVKEARDAHAGSKHRAWVASIPSLPPMGINLLSENELEEKDAAANTDGFDCHKRKAAALEGKVEQRSM